MPKGNEFYTLCLQYGYVNLTSSLLTIFEMTFLLHSVVTYFVLIYPNKSFPFDWENPIGYSIAVILQFVIVFYFLHYVACFLSIALAAYLITNSISGFLNDDFQIINEMAKNKASESNILKPFSKLIFSITEIKQLSYY